MSAPTPALVPTTLAQTTHHPRARLLPKPHQITAILLAIVVSFSSSVANSCPFCSAVKQTIRQEAAAMDAVVIASAVESDITVDPATGIIQMKIEQVLSGDKHVQAGQVVKAVYFGRAEIGRRFLLSGVDPPKLEWTCMPITKATEKYIVDSFALPDDDAARLRYYMQFLENDEEMISRDAYDEFASAPYDAVKKIKDDMDHEQLVKWLQESDIGPERKRLYFTMLGVCGTEKDLPMLEDMLRGTRTNMTSGLDALVACYLTLAGEKGLPLINELFLADHKAPFSHAYAAIMAIRFHGTEGDVIPRSALVESLHLVLERKELADMVIPDLAKWNDWSQIDRLVQLFKESDEENNWVRVPIVNYLRACPLPKAKDAVKELEEIDPESVRRASVFFPIPVPVRDNKGGTSSVTPQRSRNVEPDTLQSPVPLPNDGVLYADARNADSRTAGGVGLLATNGGNLVGIAGNEPMNPFRLVYVVSLMLATIVIGQFLVLSGGPAMGPAPVALTADGATVESPSQSNDSHDC
ncbi:hypothetical protein [Stieleria varia]|nr:hypothetical protein [Stieleria varia]